MKKIAAIFLFFIMILCSSGFYISYNLSLHNIHLRQREVILKNASLLKDRIIVFSFPLDYDNNKDVDIEFEEENEIRYNGKMYDIVSRRSTPDSIFLNCISDITEDNIREEASNQINKNTNAAKQKDYPVAKYNPRLYTFSSSTDLYFSTRNFSNFYLTYKIRILPAPFLKKPSPPPWRNLQVNKFRTPV